MKESDIQIQNIKGMPKGIPFIVGNEAAERFSFYGMKAILTVFMVQYLHMSESLTNEWYHNFVGYVYLLPILGALLSDLVLGKYRTILLLSIVYCTGHLVLACNETKNGLFWGLCLIAFGSGGIKPCVSAHVGDQFTNKNKELVTKVFGYFYFAINFGSFFSTLLIPYLLKNYGPQLAFGLPGILMAVATLVFWLGRNVFVHIPANPKQIIQEVFTKDFLKIALRLGLVYLFISVFWALYDQTGSSWVLQSQSVLMDKTINLGFVSFELLPSQIQSVNPILIMILVPLFGYVLYPRIAKVFDFKPLYKILLGMILCGLSFFIIGFIESSIYQGREISVWWQLLAYFVLTIGEVLLSLTALEYSYTQAPTSVKSIVMSLYLLSVSLGNFTTSGINKFIINDLDVQSVQVADTFVFKTKQAMTSGDKINIESDLKVGRITLDQDKELIQPLEGTFVIQKIGFDSYTLLDDSRQALKVAKLNGFDLEKKNLKGIFSCYALNGAVYYNFFAYFILATTLLFLPFAIKLKDKAHLQQISA